MILPKITKLRTFQVPPKSTNNLYYRLGKYMSLTSYRAAPPRAKHHKTATAAPRLALSMVVNE